MVGIAHGFQIHQQGRMSQLAQRHRTHQRALHAVRHALAQNFLGRITSRAARLAVVADLFVKELLYFGWAIQAREHFDRLA